MRPNRPFAASRLAAALLTRTSAAALASLVAAGCADDSLEPTASGPFGDWGPAVNLGPVVNSAANEAGPVFSPDGLALYFDSNRPGGLGGRDIWVARRARVDAPWEAPRNLGPLVNTNADDFVPALSPDGRQLFISSDRAGGLGGNDIWVSTRDATSDDLSWRAPVNLGPSVNSAAMEVAPSVATLRGRLTLFLSRGPMTNRLDLFVSLWSGGAFGSPTEVSELNAPDSTDSHVTLRQDGREIFFYSNRLGGAGRSNIWTSTRQSPNDPWSAPVDVDEVNTPFSELHPTLDFWGKTLVFGSDRPGGLGGNDLYMATRVQGQGR